MLKLTQPEIELIEFLRGSHDFGVQIIANGGETMVSTTLEPAAPTQIDVGIGGSFAEAWRARRSMPGLPAAS